MSYQDPDIQFYNAIIANPYIAGGVNVRKTASYSPTTTDVTILQDPSKYYMSIVRFTIPNSDVPIFNFLLQNESVSTTVGVYGVAMEYKGVVASQNLIYVPAKATLPVEYGVYHYTQMTDFINTALNTVYTTLSAALPAEAKAAPFVSYDANSGLLSLWAPSGYNSQAADPVKIWFNSYLWDMVNSFDLKADNYNPVTGSAADNRDYQLMVESTGVNIHKAAQTAGPPIIDFIAGSPPVIPWRSTTVSTLDWFEMKQEYNTLFLWNDTRGFRFTSTTIPSVEEYTPSVNTLNSTISNNTASITAAIKIITDMEIQASEDASNRSIVSYLPTAQYRYIELTQSGGPLKPFSFEIYSVDKFGRTQPLTITVNQSITVKFLFVKKGLSESRMRQLLGNKSIY